MADIDEILKDSDLKTDDLSDRVFGKDHSISVVGWFYREKGTKIYIVHCKICALDSAMFGGGYFKARMSNLVAGKVPCGCNPYYRCNENQASILIERILKLSKYSWDGWGEPFKGCYTKCKIKCPEHGQFQSNLSRIISGSCGCKKCSNLSVGKRFKKSDSEMAMQFMATGAYPEGTIFTRSNKFTKNGHKAYWNVYCPTCRYTSESHYANLSVGKLSCLCNPLSNQREGYIHLVFKENHLVALKFGIAICSRYRLSSLNAANSPIKLINVGTWRFPCRDSCRQAEREVKNSLSTLILEKNVFPDGYTELTEVENYLKIIEIYKKNGGKYVQ